jgi:hypothetical protein
MVSYYGTLWTVIVWSDRISCKSFFCCSSCVQYVHQQYTSVSDAVSLANSSTQSFDLFSKLYYHWIIFAKCFSLSTHAKCMVCLAWFVCWSLLLRFVSTIVSLNIYILMILSSDSVCLMIVLLFRCGHCELGKILVSKVWRELTC